MCFYDSNSSRRDRKDLEVDEATTMKQTRYDLVILGSASTAFAAALELGFHAREG
jgi:hypothetical protein